MASLLVFGLLQLGRLAKATPESEGLVSSSGANRCPIRALRKVQHSGRVPIEFADLDHTGVLPQAELILGESMTAQNLLFMGTPLQCAHLHHEDRYEC